MQRKKEHCHKSQRRREAQQEDAASRTEPVPYGRRRENRERHKQGTAKEYRCEPAPLAKLQPMVESYQEGAHVQDNCQRHSKTQGAPIRSSDLQRAPLPPDVLELTGADGDRGRSK